MHTVMIIDGGGRGSALVAKYAQSPFVKKIVVIPGNDLMQKISKKPVETFPLLKTSSVNEIVALCKERNVALVDVAQDNAIASKLVDLLEKEGIPVIGPSWLAGQIEWSKSFARICLLKKGIKQPFFRICHSTDEGIAFIESQPDQPWFIKADGLCEGKGSLPASNNDEACKQILALSQFGEAGKVFLIEKWLGGRDTKGEEFSVLTLTDGKDFKIVGTAQDHKRVFDFDQGDNTGSMGSSSSPLLLHAVLMQDVTKIIAQTLEALREEGVIYKGILYLNGMVLFENGKYVPYVIEYNARWGDPEAQVLLPGIQNDLFLLSKAVIEGNLRKTPIVLDKKVRVAVAGTTRGYPGDYTNAKGKQIFGIDEASRLPNVQILPAAITQKNGKQYANGGRLFYVVGEGKDTISARHYAYAAMSLISVEGNNLHYRTDIGWRDVQRLREGVQKV